VRRCYSLAGQRVLREGLSTYYLLTAHLGLVMAVAVGSGNLVSSQRYLSYRLPRLEPGIGETDFSFTGERELSSIRVIDYYGHWFSHKLQGLSSLAQSCRKIIHPDLCRAIHTLLTILHETRILLATPSAKMENGKKPSFPRQ
jgi:hypothetical protein